MNCIQNVTIAPKPATRPSAEVLINDRSFRERGKPNSERRKTPGGRCWTWSGSSSRAGRQEDTRSPHNLQGCFSGPTVPSWSWNEEVEKDCINRRGPGGPGSARGGRDQLEQARHCGRANRTRSPGGSFFAGHRLGRDQAAPRESCQRECQFNGQDCPAAGEGGAARQERPASAEDGGHSAVGQRGCPDRGSQDTRVGCFRYGRSRELRLRGAEDCGGRLGTVP